MKKSDLRILATALLVVALVMAVGAVFIDTWLWGASIALTLIAVAVWASARWVSDDPAQ